MSIAEPAVFKSWTYSDMVCLGRIRRYYYGDANYNAQVVCDGPPGEVGKVAPNVCNERSNERDQPSQLLIRPVSHCHLVWYFDRRGRKARTYAMEIVASAKGSPTM